MSFIGVLTNLRFLDNGAALLLVLVLVLVVLVLMLVLVVVVLVEVLLLVLVLYTKYMNHRYTTTIDMPHT